VRNLEVDADRVTKDEASIPLGGLHRRGDADCIESVMPK
jgi:hypothetical protein